MILTSAEIYKEVRKNNIIISPFNKSCLGTVSYHFHLSDEISMIENAIDSKGKIKLKKQKIPETGFVLKPNRLYLTHTLELMGSNKYAQRIFTTRKIANFGIFIHISANLGHTGAITNWTLELTVTHPVKIYPFQEIGQITFWKVFGKKSIYCGKYNFKKLHVESKFYEELQ